LNFHKWEAFTIGTSDKRLKLLSQLGRPFEGVQCSPGLATRLVHRQQSDTADQPVADELPHYESHLEPKCKRAFPPGCFHHMIEFWRKDRPTRKQVTADLVLANQCVQRRLACSVGVRPTRAIVRGPVAWIASVEETKRTKPIDKAILGMVSESPGRNASEPTGGLDKK